MAIKILDSLIESEQSQLNGFTLMHRGNQLQCKGLISSKNVKSYLSGKIMTEKTGSLPGTHVID